MAFAIKGQIKALAAFNGNYGIYGHVLFKFLHGLSILFSLRDLLHGPCNQRPKKATATFKGNFAIYGLILFKLCVEVAYCSL